MSKNSTNSTNSEIDAYGRFIVEPDRIFELLYLGAKPSKIVCASMTEEIENYNALCRLWNKTNEQIDQLSEDVDPEKDRLHRIADWKIPDEYTNLNVRQFLLDKCKRPDEIIRVNMEMDLFEERGLIDLLRLMIVLVDHFRKKSIVWGVGRGSSVSSYCLYLIGIHKIDSIKYDLDIREFLR